ncbi:MAG: IS21 family transposase [Acidimicrobiales bacterium]
MRKIRDVIRLSLGEGLSLRQVGRSLDLPFTTVGDHVRRAVAAGLSWPLPEGLSDADLEQLLFPQPAPSNIARPMPDWAYVHRELRKKGVTLELLWIEYREAHPDGYGYTQFVHHYRAFKASVDVVMRQVHRAGEKLFVDFPGMRIPIFDPRTGEVSFLAELFVAVSGASSYLYAEALRSQELLYWIEAHVHAFEAMGGCHEIVVCDNLRSGVTRPHRYEPDVNATYQEMAAHYGIAVIPTRTYKPRDKAKVEAAVLLSERWIIARLRHRRFTSLAQANQAIRSCVTEINDRPFKKLDGSRRELFVSLDRPALRPLPATRYEFATFKKAKVNIDYHVELDRHYYSVPYQLAGKVVELRCTASVVEVLFSAKRVASWPRSAVRGGYSTDPDHMPESHRRYAKWTPSRIISWSKASGPRTAELVEAILASRPHPEQGFRSALGIIRLGERHGTQRLEKACERALHLRAYSYRSVASILEHHLDERPLEEPAALPLHPHHRNLRGATYYR